MRDDIFKECQALFPSWAGLRASDFDMDDPKGFSSFTMGIRAKPHVLPLDPPAVLYRRLEGKQNAILDFDTEREVFLTLGGNQIAAHCHHYDDTCRVEAFYQGRTLTPDDLFDADTLAKIAAQLHKLHSLSPKGVPDRPFFDMIFEKWGALARRVLEDQIDVFPPNEQEMCRDLRALYAPETLAKVHAMLPDGPLTFAHNDTYHGNVMKLDGGEIRLLDFEFSCRNHKAYDFSNLFAETVMKHGLSDYPYFRIDPPEYGDRELGLLIGAYLDHETFASDANREAAFTRLMADTKALLPLSDFKYAMAAVTLAVEPIQKIRFIPYAHQRFAKFLRACEVRLS
jgi:thiamine kinase-like enzyme